MNGIEPGIGYMACLMPTGAPWKAGEPIGFCIVDISERRARVRAAQS